jgi:putative ABC transport system permease protein
MIRWETAIIAVFGTLGGLGVGLFLGWVLVKAASDSTTGHDRPDLRGPDRSVVPVLMVGAIAGVLAGIRPARRAAKLPVLHAMAME